MHFTIIAFIVTSVLLLFSCTEVLETEKSYGEGNASYLIPITKKEDFSDKQIKDLETLGYRLIKAGEFEMGSPLSEPGRAPIEKTNDVTLDLNNEKIITTKITNDFFIGRFEVSNAEWALVWKTSKKIPPSLPVVEVSHTRAMSYCKELTILLKIMNVLPKELVCRLPTEAEWEYVCRAGNTGVHGFKMNDADQAKFKNVLSTDDANMAKPSGNNRENKLYGNDPSKYSYKLFSMNRWGIYHMHGNVREWCYDYFTKRYSKVDGEEEEEYLFDPVGNLNGKHRVLRGGSYRSFWTQCRAAARDSAVPYEMMDDIGFRVVIGYPIR